MDEVTPRALNGPLLDHIVILVPPEILASPPPWLTQNFNIITGGRHTNGISENKLIVLQDGVYIEMIAFIKGTSRDDRMKHRWGRCEEGMVIDWAFTLNEPDQFGRIQERVKVSQGDISYHDPVQGGRVKPDGTEIRWSVADPSNEVVGKVPFWCFDITPRELRVPTSNSKTTTHPSGARGVASIAVEFKDDQAAHLIRPIYNAIHNSEPSETSWDFGTPRGGHGKTMLVSRSGKAFGLSLGLWADVQAPTVISGELGGGTIEIQLRPKT